MELFSLRDMPRAAKVALLKELGYGADDTHVLDARGEPVIDPYIDEPVRLENMTILPGSTVIIDDNPLSIASFLEDHGGSL